MSPVVDFSGIQSAPKPVEGGKYPVRLAEYSYDASGNYYKCKLAIAEGDYAGRPLYTNKSLKPQALWAMREMCLAFGIEEEVLSSPDVDLDEVLATIVEDDMTALAIVGVKIHEEKEVNEVKSIKPWDGFSA